MPDVFRIIYGTAKACPDTKRVFLWPVTSSTSFELCFEPQHPGLLRIEISMLRALIGIGLILSSVASFAGTVSGTLMGPSGLPVKNGVLGFTLQQAGLAIGSGGIAALSANCYTSSDGTVVGLPNPLAPPTIA